MGVPQLYLALASVPAKSGFAFASMDARGSWICTILSSLQSVIAVSIVPDENLVPANQMDFRCESPFCATSCHGWQTKRRRSKGPAHEQIVTCCLFIFAAADRGLNHSAKSDRSAPRITRPTFSQHPQSGQECAKRSALLNLLRMTYAEPVLVCAMLQGASWSKSNFCWGMSLRSDYRTISSLQATDSVGCQRSPSNRTLTLRFVKGFVRIEGYSLSIFRLKIY